MYYCDYQFDSMKPLFLFAILTAFLFSCVNPASRKELDEKQAELEKREQKLKEKEQQLEQQQQSQESSTTEVQKEKTEEPDNNAQTLPVGEFTYIPNEASSVRDAQFVVSYSFLEGANRPKLSIKFKDGFSLSFNAVCEGDFPWCIRNTNQEDVGYLRLKFAQNGKVARIDIKKNNLSSQYSDHLNMLVGKLNRI
jgi:hypothetical protein